MIIETMTFTRRVAGEDEYVLLRDVVIPAGTVLARAPNERGGSEAVEACVEMGRDSVAYFHMRVRAIPDAPKDLITQAVSVDNC